MKRPYKARSIAHTMREQQSQTAGDAQPTQTLTLGADEPASVESVTCPTHGQLSADEYFTVPRSELALCVICCFVAFQKAGVRALSVKRQ